MQPRSQTSGAADTRQRLIDVAVDLFTRYSFAGTSLQMIADELGFTKAAIYHHFRTRDQLLDAVVEPILERAARRSSPTPKQLRGAHARADHMLNGFARAGGRESCGLGACGRPGGAEMLRTTREWDALDRATDGTARRRRSRPGRTVKAAIVLAGIAGASGPTFANLDRDECYAQPRRRPAGAHSACGFAAIVGLAGTSCRQQL